MEFTQQSNISTNLVDILNKNSNLTPQNLRTKSYKRCKVQASRFITQK